MNDQTFGVAENSANGSAVGSVIASDADTSQTLTYAITGGDPTGVFTIDAATGGSLLRFLSKSLITPPPQVPSF